MYIVTNQKHWNVKNSTRFISIGKPAIAQSSDLVITTKIHAFLNPTTTSIKPDRISGKHLLPSGQPLIFDQTNPKTTYHTTELCINIYKYIVIEIINSDVIGPTDSSRTMSFDDSLCFSYRNRFPGPFYICFWQWF